MATTTNAWLLGVPGGLEIREGPCCFVLELDDSLPLGLLQAAAGIVSMAPESDGRVRALEILEEGGAKAVELAVAVVGRRLRGGAVRDKDPRV